MFKSSNDISGLLRKPVFWIVFLLAVFPALAQPGAPQIMLTKPERSGQTHFSGDGQSAAVQAWLARPLQVRVTDENGRPLPGISITFTALRVPSKASPPRFSDSIAVSDEEGIAQTRVRLGNRPGAYHILARIEGNSHTATLLIFEAQARKKNWWLHLLIGLSGGLAIFLYGMNMMSEGMQKTAGDRLRAILKRISRNRIVAVFVGAIVTMIIQSSSATTVMLVSFVQARLMTFAQTLGIILGADIGTTVTAQLIAFKLTDYALLMVAIGAGFLFLGRNERAKHIGETILGFGLLFYGMHIMSKAMVPLRSYAPVIDLLVRMENPLLGILIGTIFTALIQSSSAFTGIIIVLASQGLLTLEAGIPLLFGANLGTCFTAALAALNTGREAKRVALAHISFKVVGVLLFVGWIPWLAEIVRWMSPQAVQLGGAEQLAAEVPRQIANAHTLFNVALTIVALPFVNGFAKLIDKLLPDLPPATETVAFSTRFLDPAMLSTPTLALNLAKAEVLHMGEIVKGMVQKIILPFTQHDQQAMKELADNENEVDFLENKIYEYLTQISRKDLPSEQVDEVFQMMYTVTDLEQIADIVSKNLIPRANEWLKHDYHFSEDGTEELMEYHRRTVNQIQRALNVFEDVNLEAAREMKKTLKKYRHLQHHLMRTHFERLMSHVPETMVTSEYHQDLMGQFRRINGHATNIARTLLEWSRSPKDRSPAREVSG